MLLFGGLPQAEIGLILGETKHTTRQISTKVIRAAGQIFAILH